MRYLLLIYFSVTFCSASAQSVDSLQHSINIDSMSIPNDSLSQFTAAATSKIDSLDKLTKLKKVDSLTIATQNKIDSLTALNLPSDKYQSKLDSLTRHYPNQVKQKLVEIKAKMNTKIENTRSKITKKLSSKKGDKISDKLSDQENIGDVTNQLSDEKIGKVEEIANGGFPEIDGKLPNTDINIPIRDVGIDNPIGEVSNPLTDEVESYSGELEEITSAPSTELNEIKDKVGVTDINEDLSKVTAYGNEVDKVSENLEKTKKGDLSGVDQRIEERALDHTELGTLKEQSGKFDQLKSELDSQIEAINQYQDPRLVKQRILEKSKYVSNNVLEKYKNKVLAAQADLTSYKPDSIWQGDSLLKYLPNQLEYKRWLHRLLPGMTWEITSESKINFDFAPFIGFRINKKINFWVGYMYRIEFNKDENTLSTQPMYGPRVSANYSFYKGFYVRASAERLRADIATFTGETNRYWINGIFFGLGKDYKLGSLLKGDIHAMYNVLFDNKESPYTKRVNIRFGFYFNNLTKTKRPTWKKKLKSIRKRNK